MKTLAERAGYTPGPWKRNLYDHGGSRIYTEDQGSRDLIFDTYQNRAISDLAFHSRETLEALVSLMQGVDSLPPLTAIAGLLEEQWATALKAIEDATGMTWEDLNK